MLLRLSSMGTGEFMKICRACSICDRVGCENRPCDDDDSGGCGGNDKLVVVVWVGRGVVDRRCLSHVWGCC